MVFEALTVGQRWNRRVAPGWRRSGEGHHLSGAPCCKVSRGRAPTRVGCLAGPGRWGAHKGGCGDATKPSPGAQGKVQKQ